MNWKLVDEAFKLSQKGKKPFTKKQIQTVFSEYFHTITKAMDNFTAPAIMMYGIGTFRISTKASYTRLMRINEKLSSETDEERREMLQEEYDYVSNILKLGLTYDQDQHYKYVTKSLPNKPTDDQAKSESGQETI